MKNLVVDVNGLITMTEKQSFINRVVNIILDVCFQFAKVDYKDGIYIFYSYGLSTLENCFEFLIDTDVAEGNCLRIEIRKKVIDKFKVLDDD